MTDPQAQHPVDELFRNAFQKLSDTPSSNGWDVPSDRVWKHVQPQIRTPKKIIWLAGAITAMALIGAVLLFWSRAGQDTPASAPVEQPAAAPSLPVEVAKETPITNPTEQNIETKAVEKTGQSDTKTGKTKKTPPAVSHEGTPERPGVAAPLPGSKNVVAPNTLE